MSAREELQRHYQDWRDLTVDEGEAIDAADWPGVARCQQAKLELQTRITRAGELLERETAGLPSRREADEAHLRAVVNELIQLEQRNSERLATRQQQAEAERAQLDQAGRQLRQIHRSYVPGEAATHWQSYS